jgi:hypothetical protein
VNIEDWFKMCVGKTRWGNESVAQKCATRLVAEGKVKLMRVYSCPHCFGFHISSKPEMERKHA